MRCPHCRGEIPAESQFCGVCGQNIVLAPLPRGSGGMPGGGHSSASLFDLPVSKGARLVRMAMILGLNLLLIGGGIALTLEYLHKRDRAARGQLSGTAASSDSATTPKDATQPGQGVVDAGASQGGTRAQDDAGRQAGRETALGSDSVTDSSKAPSSRSDAGASSASGNQGRETTTAPPSTRDPDAGPNPRQPSAADAGLSASGEAVSPEEEARRVRVLTAQISQVVEGHQGQLKRCYESAAKVTTPDAPIVGRIDVRFTVQGDGSASSVRTNANDTGSASLENCLLALVRSWTFPATGGEALDFVWPFEFQAPK